MTEEKVRVVDTVRGEDPACRRRSELDGKEKRTPDTGKSAAAAITAARAPCMAGVKFWARTPASTTASDTLTLTWTALTNCPAAGAVMEAVGEGVGEREKPVEGVAVSVAGAVRVGVRLGVGLQLRAVVIVLAQEHDGVAEGVNV
jgi:hypothetical protein